MSEAVKSGRTTGPALGQAVSRVGQDLAQGGVGMAEQMAVLTALQGTRDYARLTAVVAAFL